MTNGFNFLIYKTPDKDVKVNAVIKDDTIWLTQKSMAELFGCSSDNISLHLKNIFEAGELEKDSVTEKISATAADGKNYPTNFYNLDAIISVGYRVNSIQATHFRIWATKVLTFNSVKHIDISLPTIKQYLDYLQDSFIINKVLRYDIKGKKYISTPSKYYFTDIGLRNARLNFRQQEETHIMENIIYNELNIRGYEVDVGEIGILEKNATGYTEKKVEVDFVASKGSKKYYIQSAFMMPTEEKKAQEERPLLKITDSFKKIIIVKDNIKPYHDDNGIGFIGLKDFLLDMNSLDF